MIRAESLSTQFLDTGKLTGLEICNVPEVTTSELVVVEGGDELELIELVPGGAKVVEDVAPTVVVGELDALVDTAPFEDDNDVDCAGGALEELVYVIVLDVPELVPAATDELPD